MVLAFKSFYLHSSFFFFFTKYLFLLHVILQDLFVQGSHSVRIFKQSVIQDVFNEGKKMKSVGDHPFSQLLGTHLSFLIVTFESYTLSQGSSSFPLEMRALFAGNNDYGGAFQVAPIKFPS